MKPLDPATVARRFWTGQPGETSWDQVVARRDARVLRVTRRLTRQHGAATRAQIRDAAMIERGNYGYGNNADTVASLLRLIRRRQVLELTFAAGRYYLAGDTCPTCGTTLKPESDHQ